MKQTSSKQDPKITISNQDSKTSQEDLPYFCEYCYFCMQWGHKAFYCPRQKINAIKFLEHERMNTARDAESRTESSRSFDKIGYVCQ